MEENFERKLANVVLKEYESVLKQKFKSSHEVFTTKTILAAFIIEDTSGGELKVVSIGTGTKSLNKHSYNPLGTEIHDSHAEIVARRALVTFFSNEVIGLLTDKLSLDKSILTLNKKKTKFRLKKRYQLHFFTTKPPCGGCSLDLTQGGSDFAFTGGAKALKNFWISNDKTKIEERQSSDLMTKPFRSDTPVENRSASLSCSDKIMTWNILGLQGKILGLFLQPVYIDSIIIVGNPAHEKTIKNGLTLQGKLELTKETAENRCIFHKEKRISVRHKVNEPVVRILDQNEFAVMTKDTALQTLSYEATKKESKLSTISLGAWWNGQAGRISAEEADVIVGTTGLKPGANPKNSDSLKLSPALSKAHLTKQFQKMFDALGSVCEKNLAINVFKKNIQNYLDETNEGLMKNGVFAVSMKYDSAKYLNFREVTIKSKLKTVFGLWTLEKQSKGLDLAYKSEIVT